MSSICLERLSAEGQTPGDLVFTVSQLRQAPFGPSDIQQPSRISALASDAEKEASLDGEKQIEEPQPQSKREEGETLSSAHTHGTAVLSYKTLQAFHLLRSPKTEIPTATRAGPAQ